MRWPWKRNAEAQAETEVAKQQYESTLRDEMRISTVLSSLFYHAEKNEFVEKIQRVARGH